MFDEPITEILKFIDKEIEYLKWDQPEMKIVSNQPSSLPLPLRERALTTTQQSYLVLSGGLGSSLYVQTKFIEKFSDQDTKVLFAKEAEEPYVPCSALSTLLTNSTQPPCGLQRPCHRPNAAHPPQCISI